MKYFQVLVILSVSIINGCATNTYSVQQAEYTALVNGEVQYRKKPILVNSQTGEVWGLYFDKKYGTLDGYAWVKMPVEGK